MSEPAETDGAMFDKYCALDADTSCHEHDILRGDGTIPPAWRSVILRHPDRLMIGTDTWVNNQWDSYADLIALNRRWLAKLQKELAERIAYKNAVKLLERKTSVACSGLGEARLSPARFRGLMPAAR